MSDSIPFVHADPETHTFKDANGNEIDAGTVTAAIDGKTIDDFSWDFAKFLEWGQDWARLDAYYADMSSAG